MTFSLAGKPTTSERATYYVDTMYILRMRLPKYVYLLIKKRLISQPQVEELLRSQITGFRGATLEMHDLQLSHDAPEVTFILRWPDRYDKNIMRPFCMKCRAIVNVLLDVCRMAVTLGQETKDRRLVGWSYTEKSGIRYPRTRSKRSSLILNAQKSGVTDLDKVKDKETVGVTTPTTGT